MALFPPPSYQPSMPEEMKTKAETTIKPGTCMYILIKHNSHVTLASIPGRTEDGPGIDCLRMRHLLPRKWVIRILLYYAQ